MALPEESALRELMTGFKRLLQSGQHSDLTICSTDQKYAVHKAVVCPQSTFFWSACTNDFQERESKTIHLPDDDPNAVHCMIRYLYTLTYPDESAVVGVVSQDSPNGMCVGDASGLGPVADHQESIDDPTASDARPHIGWHAVRDDITAVEQTVMAREEKPKFPNSSSEGHIERGVDLSKASPDVTLCYLHQDLRVYALADKYGIQNLKKKAHQHFGEALGHMELTMGIFEIIRDVYSSTPLQDRGLRDIITARMYGEIQYWIMQDQFMTQVRREGDFCADLLAYTAKESLKQYEAALASIEHPGYCEQCRATLVMRRWVSRRKNVHLDKYCAKCDPWH